MKKWILGLATLAVCGAAAAIALAQGAPSLTLYKGEGYSGEVRRIDRAVKNLDSVRFNDSARSLVAEGRWEVCLDAAFQGQCRVVQGRVGDMGEWGGSISSVRYLGPADWGASEGQAPKVASKQAATPAVEPAEEWRPMQKTDLWGGDYNEFDLKSGQDWRVCKAACDEDSHCLAWTTTLPNPTPHGRCFLKYTVPEPSEAECCTSGIKGAPSAAGPTASGAKMGARSGVAREPTEAEKVAKRAAQTAGDEAERRAHDRIREGVARLF